mgnify:FL=1
MTFAIISDQRIARLNTDFGLKLAEKWFPNMVEMLPRYKRGKNKGQLRGCITWRKVERGGWHGGPIKGGTCIDRQLHSEGPVNNLGYPSPVAVYEVQDGSRFPVPVRTYLHPDWVYDDKQLKKDQEAS